MEYTKNYELVKPSPDDFYNIDDHNGNMDIIDEALKDIKDEAQAKRNEHLNANNPHNITADTVGLGKVNNTSDADKPVSISQAAAIANAKAEANATAMNYVQISTTAHVKDYGHVSSIERANWNSAVSKSENASELLDNGGFKHLQDVEIYLPAENAVIREWDILMPRDEILKSTALKVIIKAKFMGEVTKTNTSIDKCIIELGVNSNRSESFYKGYLSLEQTGAFTTKEFTISQEFTIHKQLRGNVDILQPISQSVDNPPFRIGYVHPLGFVNEGTVATGKSDDYNFCDFRMRLTLPSQTSLYCKVGIQGMIEFYAR